MGVASQRTTSAVTSQATTASQRVKFEPLPEPRDAERPYRRGLADEQTGARCAHDGGDHHPQHCEGDDAAARFVEGAPELPLSLAAFGRAQFAFSEVEADDAQ